MLEIISTIYILGLAIFLFLGLTDDIKMTPRFTFTVIGMSLIWFIAFPIYLLNKD